MIFLLLLAWLGIETHRSSKRCGEYDQEATAERHSKLKTNECSVGHKAALLHTVW